MLNRRVLRVKVLQALYSFKQAEKANQNLAKDFLDERFQPDLNSMVIPDKRQLQMQKGKAKTLFDQWIKTQNEIITEDQEIADALNDAINLYLNNIEKDKSTIDAFLIQDIEDAFKQYLALLYFPVVLAEFVNVEIEEKKKKRYSTDKSPNLRLLENKVIKKIKENQELQKAIAKNSVSWDDEDSFIRQIFKESLLENDHYIDYISRSSDPTFDNDKAIVLDIYKEVLFGFEAFHSFYEEKDLQWIENHKIIKGMVLKTIKSIKEDEDFSLLSISLNWDDDKEFFRKLFKATVDNDRFLDEIIVKKSDNWDIDRIAMTDKIIIKSALAEMMNFPSIPIKVTINEFIELSKDYSTPKSKHFINGMLDRASRELSEKGDIKKTGRGLIDNK